MGLWLQIGVYAVVGLIVAGATWYVLHTIDRAELSYTLETTLKAEREQAAVNAALFKSVNADAVEVSRGLSEAVLSLETLSKQRGKTYAKVANPSAVCIDADVMRVLNNRTTAPAVDDDSASIRIPGEGSGTPSARSGPTDTWASAGLRGGDFDGLRSAGVEVESPRGLGRQMGRLVELQGAGVGHTAGSR